MAKTKAGASKGEWEVHHNPFERSAADPWRPTLFMLCVVLWTAAVIGVCAITAELADPALGAVGPVQKHKVRPSVPVPCQPMQPCPELEPHCRCDPATPREASQ